MTIVQRRAVITVLLTAVFSGCLAGDGSYRLSKEVLPQTYDIVIKPYLPNATFVGTVQINVSVEGNVNPIVLHANSINVTSITVQKEEENVYDEYNYRDNYDFLEIHLKKNATTGYYSITINYTGTLHDDMYGFYRSTYGTNAERVIAATQFQPTHARKAFPCFDEPDFKARFTISIYTPTGYHSLSNTGNPTITSTPGEEEFTLYTFPQSPPMSTYLVAFVVSDFKKLNTTYKDLEFATWAQENAINASQYSIDVSPQILEALELFTGLKYTVSGLNKIDQVALPDFSAGAMENWGLVTYRETALLYDVEKVSARGKQRVATVIAHELAHMWFGNLVTLTWWEHTWINEGFARFFENFATNQVESTWRLMDQMVVSQLQTIFLSDSLNESEPLTHECNTPSEVTAMFGGITYNKGGCVLRMFSHSLTPDVFKNGLRNYLAEMKFNSTSPDILIQYLAKYNTQDVDVKQLVKSWTEKAGYPVIYVNRNYENKSATVNQTRFFSSPGFTSDSTWLVPLTWTNQKDLKGFEVTKPAFWLKEKTGIIFDLGGSDEWVIFNNQETGFYRVNYDSQNWLMLANTLRTKHEDIHVLNRAQLVDDAMNIARAGQLDYDVALTMTMYLKNESDYIPWEAALSAFSFLRRRLASHPNYSHFEAYIRGLLSKSYDKLGFEDNGDHIEKLHRELILKWACDLDLEDCNQQATAKLKDLVTNGTKVSPDLQSVVYCAGLKDGDANTWKFLWELYRSSTTATEKTLILTSLGCTKNATLLKQYLKKSIENNGDIRKQDAASVFSAVYINPEGVDIALDFLNENFDDISQFYIAMGSLGNVVRGIAEQLSSVAQKEKFEQFVSKYAAELDADGRKALQTVQENMLWLETYQDAIFSVLKEEDNGSDGSSLLVTLPFTIILAFTAGLMYLS